MRSSSPFIANAVTATTGMALSSWSSLSQIGYFETGDFRQRNVHQNQVGAALAGEIERPNAVARADGMVAVSLQQVVEELHVELIVLHAHHGLRHPAELKRLAISVTTGLAVLHRCFAPQRRATAGGAIGQHREP